MLVARYKSDKRVKPKMTYTVTSHYQPIHDDPRKYIDNMELVMGRLPDRMKYDFMHNQSRTFGDLTELLLSRAAPVVAQQVTGLIEKSYVSPFTTFLLPIKQLPPGASANIEWSEISFAGGFAPETETLGTARIFTHNKSKHGARIIRRMAGIKTEAGFFMTPEGREEWRLKIEQLATIIQNTNEYDVLLTLLQTPMRHEISAQEMNGPYNHVYGASDSLGFEDRIKLDRDLSTLFNKSADSKGVVSAIANFKTTMARKGVHPDALIVPPFLISYFHTSKIDMWEYSSAGPQNQQARQVATMVDHNNMSLFGLRVIDSYINRAVQGARESVCDLLTTPKAIGEYYPMEISMLYRNASEFDSYKTSDRNVKIHDEENARISPVYFTEALKHTFRFDEQGRLIPEYYYDIDDMFTSYHINGVSRVTDYWGQMQDQYFLPVYMEGTLRTLRNAARRHGLNSALFKKQYAGNEKRDAEDALRTLFNHLLHNADTLNVKDAVDGKCDNSKFGANAWWFPWVSNLAPLDRALMLAFLMSGITLKNMEKLASEDIFFPVDIVLTRPHKTYNMSSIIIMKAGDETGNLYLGPQDFQMSSNTQDRTLEGSYAYYGKAIVRNKANVLVAPNVFCQSYERGNNLEFVSWDTLQNEIHERSGVYHSSESIIALMVPVSLNTGTFNRSWIDYRGRNNENAPGQKFHGAADYYEQLFKLEPARLAQPLDPRNSDYIAMNYPANSICWLGHMEYGPQYEYVNANKGHLGPNTYDMVHMTRKEGVYESMKPIGCNSKTKY